MTAFRRTETPARIDRSKPISFTFDGKMLSGFSGDTLASALLANGKTLLGRSFKYHRPRGVIAAGLEEPNALFTTGIYPDGRAGFKPFDVTADGQRFVLAIPRTDVPGGALTVAVNWMMTADRK